ncbi:MAG: hypothetical protein WBX18_17125 [Terracidiphilus sp.]
MRCVASARRGRIDAPRWLALWHLASLDAPTVAVVWSMGFAWAAGVRLPAWVGFLLALAVWAVYVADRLLDVRAGLRSSETGRLRERHSFHWRHRRVLLPLAVTAACCAVALIADWMPAVARERDSLLAVASLAYFARVHSGRGPRPFLLPLLTKELLVGVLFTLGCALPAAGRLLATPHASLWPLGCAAAFFALLAWLNCHAIDCWESRTPYRIAGRPTSLNSVSAVAGKGFTSCGDYKKRSSGAKEAAEKGKTAAESRELAPAGAKAHVHFATFAARLKSCPFTKPLQIAIKASLCAASKARLILCAFAARLNSRTDIKQLEISPWCAGCLLAVASFALAFLFSALHPRTAALLLAGAASALLLAVLDLKRRRLSPVALRAAADLVLLTPAWLLFVHGMPWAIAWVGR